MTATSDRVLRKSTVSRSSHLFLQIDRSLILLYITPSMLSSVLRRRKGRVIARSVDTRNVTIR